MRALECWVIPAKQKDCLESAGVNYLSEVALNCAERALECNNCCRNVAVRARTLPENVRLKFA